MQFPQECGGAKLYNWIVNLFDFMAHGESVLALVGHGYICFDASQDLNWKPDFKCVCEHFFFFFKVTTVWSLWTKCQWHIQTQWERDFVVGEKKASSVNQSHSSSGCLPDSREFEVQSLFVRREHYLELDAPAQSWFCVLEFWLGCSEWFKYPSAII